MLLKQGVFGQVQPLLRNLAADRGHTPNYSFMPGLAKLFTTVNFNRKFLLPTINANKNCYRRR